MTSSSKTPRKSSLRSPNRFSYPLFLDLSGKVCLVVGGGRVAERKCISLVNAGAEVVIISPAITPSLQRYVQRSLITYKARRYRSGDLSKAFLVVIATDSDETNASVAREAMAANKLVNTVDNPPLCNCIVPSLVRRGLLTIAISTGGASPALAKAIRKELEGLYGAEFVQFLKAMKRIRSLAMEEIPDKKERERFLKGVAEGILKGTTISKPGGRAQS